MIMQPISIKVEYKPKAIVKFIGNTNITNIYRIQAYGLMCGYFCIGFINFIFKGKRLLHYTNSLSPNDYIKYGKIIFKYFNNKYGRKKAQHLD